MIKQEISMDNSLRFPDLRNMPKTSKLGLRGNRGEDAYLEVEEVGHGGLGVLLDEEEPNGGLIG